MNVRPLESDVDLLGGDAADVAAWSRPADEVLDRLGVESEVGLPAQEAARRLDSYGPNTLPREVGRSLLGMVGEQLTDTMIVVLLGAAVLTTAVGDLKDTAVILGVVLINTSLGVFQERKAARAVAELAHLQPPTARVVRDGVRRRLDAEQLVPGDVVELEAGDVMPADVRLVFSAGLQVDESVLTGEAVSVLKDPAATVPRDAPVADRTSMVHAGTTVTNGRARGVVTATGSRAELGRVAGLLAGATVPTTQLQRRLAELGRLLAAGCVGLCLVVLVLGLIRGQPTERMLVTAVSLAVAAIPESLPAVVALSLALGAQRMARHHALIRRLPAVESLGSVTVIASDKTGTLTEGRMVARRLWLPDRGPLDVSELSTQDGKLGTDVRALLVAVTLCNDAHLGVNGAPDLGDPTEVALARLAAECGMDLDRLRRAAPRVGELPCDVGRKRMTTFHGDGTVGQLACKGAPEAVLSSEVLRPGTDLTDPTSTAAELAAAGFRVLAVAARRSVPLDLPPAHWENGLELLGMVALADPPRASAAAAVEACRGAGIVPLMITGDHPATALAVARQVGIADSDADVLTGAEMQRSGSGNDSAPRDLTSVRVFARIAPEQKLDIVEAWQGRGHVVAMTGDGVNDAPALRRADVGVAMGRNGTDVAREAADVVLADDDFATIVAAVHEGRRVYGNIRQFLHYALAGGVAEILVMLVGPAVGLSVPLLPAQILWINLLTHGLPGVGFGAEPAEADVLRRQPRDPQESVLGTGLWQATARLGIAVAAAALVLGAVASATGRPAQTFVFLGLGWAVLGSSLGLRSESRPFWRISLRTNPLLSTAVAAGLALQLLAVEWAPLRDFLDLEELSLFEIGCIAAVSLVGLAEAEIDKLVLGRRTARSR